MHPLRSPHQPALCDVAIIITGLLSYFRRLQFSQARRGQIPERPRSRRMLEASAWRQAAGLCAHEIWTSAACTVGTTLAFQMRTAIYFDAWQRVCGRKAKEMFAFRPQDITLRHQAGRPVAPLQAQVLGGGSRAAVRRPAGSPPKLAPAHAGLWS